MSDHQSDVNPVGPGAESEAMAPYSSNGNDSGGPGIQGEDRASQVGDDAGAFMADLARAMQSTAAAEQARNAEGTEQRRQAYVDAIRAREALEAEDLRELAKEDVKGIDAWSDGEVKRIKLERERRIASRREQLQIRLEEHRSVIAREVDAVESAIAAYRTEIELYFQRIGSETDPVTIARHAGNRPAFPVLELIGPDDAPATSTYRPIVHEAAAAPDPQTPDDGPAGDAERGSQTDTPLVGVMDHDSGSNPPETAWSSGSDAVAEPAPTEPVAATEVSEVPDNTDASEEPVAAVAEARVVMPRSTGAGSWLRWPNSSIDRSDTSR